MIEWVALCNRSGTNGGGDLFSVHFGAIFSGSKSGGDVRCNIGRNYPHTVASFSVSAKSKDSNTERTANKQCNSTNCATNNVC